MNHPPAPWYITYKADTRIPIRAQSPRTITLELAREEAEINPERVIAAGALMNALGALCDYDWRSVQPATAEDSSKLNSLLEQGRTALRKAWGLEW